MRVDFDFYDRRVRQVRWALAGSVAVSVAAWIGVEIYVGETQGEAYGLPFLLALTCVICLGAYALSLMSELKANAQSYQRQSAENVDLARRDRLTGLLNRTTFIETVHDQVREARAGRPCALFLLDLDRFKPMNDMFGHAFGDAVLARVGKVLSREVGADNAGRLGGDEFGFVLNGPISKSTCEAVAMQVLDALHEVTMIEGRTVQVEASIGISWSPEHDVDRLDLMACADLALYRAKSGGRGRVESFDRMLMQDETYRRGLERELRGAILMDELEVHYQPIVDSSSKQIYALEALVRWRHPVRGYISPSEFIPIAERTALIEQLGLWVFRKICEDAAQWPGLIVGANVSPAQLKRRDFLAKVNAVLDETGCDASRLAIEITEGLLMDGSNEQIAQLHALRKCGFSLWLDDFGAGHSGLTYLRDFPIDLIKIDKSFVQDMRSSESNRLFVSTIAQLGRGLSKNVIAEGIETEEDLLLVRASGCSHAQGFLFARPMRAADVPAFIERAGTARAA